MKTVMTFLLGLLSLTILQAGTPPYVPADGLLAWYPFSGNAGDESGNNRHGTVKGAMLTTDRDGHPNSAYSFGDNQSIVIPGTAGMNVYPMTVSLWFYSDASNTGETTVFEKYEPAAWNGFRIGTNGGGAGTNLVPWYIRSPQNRVLGLYGEEPFQYSGVSHMKWYHAVFSVDQTGGKLYINGKLEGEHPWTGTPGPSSNPYLWKIGGLYNTWFRGKIDDVGIWNRALSPEEIKQLFTGEISQACLPAYVPTDGLLGYWPFCGNANDESGNSRHGTVSGAVLTADRDGHPNSAYSFGDNQSIVIPGTAGMNVYPMTVSLWFYTDASNTGETTIFQKYVPAAWNGFRIGTNGSGAGTNCVPWYIRSPQNRVLGLYGEEPFQYSGVSPMKWHHAVFTVDQSGGKLYINGKLEADHPWTGTPGPSSNQYLWKIGGLYNTWFRGKIDDVGIWNRALTPEEIKQLFTGDNTQACLPAYVPTDGLLGFWPFCGNANDESGNGHHGQVNGSVLTTDRNNQAESAYSFDGFDDYIGLPTLGQMDRFTLTAWVYADDLPGTNELRSILGNYTWKSGDFHWHLNGALFTFAVWAETPYLVLTNDFIKSKSWHHVALVYARNEHARLYVDGQEVGQKTYTKTINFTGTRIGSEFGDRYWRGKIDDVGIWNRALTPEEIQSLYGRPDCRLIGSVTVHAKDSSDYLWSTGDIGSSVTVDPATTPYVWVTDGVCTDTVFFRADCPDVPTPLPVKDTIVTRAYINDTIVTHVSVTDTLVIDVMLSGLQRSVQNVSVSVYPNPASTILYVDVEDYRDLEGYSVLITSVAGAQVFATKITQPLIEIDLLGWPGPGLYALAILDSAGKLVETKKIIVQ